MENKKKLFLVVAVDNTAEPKEKKVWLFDSYAKAEQHRRWLEKKSPLSNWSNIDYFVFDELNLEGIG